MSFNPTPFNNLRILYREGELVLEQAFIVPRRGRSDTMPDQIADSEEIGTEDWTEMARFTDLSAAVLDAFVIMLEEDVQLRVVESELLSAQAVQRTLDQLAHLKL